jgi:hypothetical protein
MPATTYAAHTAAATRTAPDSARAARWALRVLQAGAVACVLAALPFRLFELDRYTVPKELVLHLSAGGGALLCLAAARRLTVFVVDGLLAAFLLITLLSALTATNGWLAFQALGVSLSGAALFWTARTVTRAGYGRPLLAAVAAAVVLGAAMALAQAYGLVTTPLFSLTRAPGGTFGNRNFVAHLAAIGLPALLLVAMEARGRARFALGMLGVALVAATLFLTRSRAGWLGAGLSSAFLVIQGLWLGRLWHDPALRSRTVQLGAAAVVGVTAAWLLPNRLNWRSDSPYLESLAGMANYKEGSGRGRLIQYRNSLAMAAAHPLLGVGPGNWPVQYPRFMAPNDPSFDADDFIPTNPWPSSDWVAMMAERGFLAGLLFAVIGLALALAAWMRARQRGPDGRPLYDLTIVATLVAAAVVGAFDAVLLLPVPTFFFWTTVGALASTAQPLRDVPLSPAGRRRIVIVAGIVVGLLVTRAAGRITAMALYDGGTPRVQSWAARVDPGNFRIHMLLGMASAAKRRCAAAVPHARAAHGLFPNYPAPRRLLRRCGVRKVVSLVTAGTAMPFHIPSNTLKRIP